MIRAWEKIHDDKQQILCKNGTNHAMVQPFSLDNGLIFSFNDFESNDEIEIYYMQQYNNASFS